MYEILHIKDASEMGNPAGDAEKILHNTNYNDRVVIDPVLHFISAVRGTLTFNIAPNNPEYDELIELKSVVIVRLGSWVRFTGRVLSISAEFNTVKEVVCEDLMGIFNDVYIPPFSDDMSVRQLLDMIISKYNERLSGGYFKLNSAAVSTSLENKEAEWQYTGYVKAKDLLDDILEKYGGFMYAELEDDGKITLRYLKYEDNDGNFPGNVEFYPVSPQVLKFGSNIMDISQFFDGMELKTQIIPLGKTDVNGERLTIESVNAGDDYLRATVEHTEKYGIVEGVVIHDDIEDADELLKAGRKDLKKAVKPLSNIELKAIDLQRLDVSAGHLICGEYARVVSEPHNIDTHLKIREITLYLENPEKDEIILGDRKSEITD